MFKDVQRDIRRTTFSVFARNKGILQHVFNVLDRVGFSYVNYTSNEDWSLFWAHEYPFNKEMARVFQNMKAYQKVNKIPGMTLLTNKINLVTSNLTHIPQAFRLPQSLPELKRYSKKYPKTIFVHKNAGHRGIVIRTPEEVISSVNVNQSTFAQVYVPNPLLIDGYKFDIGVYVIVSSIFPLRVYVYEGDAQFRFCRKKYHPFDKKDVEKYVVGGSFRPIWKVPSLSKLYNHHEYTRREVFNAHVRSLGKDPVLIWKKIYDIMHNVFISQATQLSSAVKKYPYPNSFFELVRFDFILDSKFNIYLMEINMSPNLSSMHYSKQATMFEQVIYNSLRLVNVARGGILSDSLKETSAGERKMQVSDRDIAVSPEVCSSFQCTSQDSCKKVQCQLCKECLSHKELTSIYSAYLEHLNRHACKRLIPKPLQSREKAKKEAQPNSKYYANLSPGDLKMHQWFLQKCLQNEKWCE